MAAGLIFSKRGVMASAAIFLFYFMMKYYLLILSIGSDDQSQSFMPPTPELRSKEISPMTTVSVPRPQINISSKLLFGNDSCRMDALGAPEFVRTAGCNNGECDIITCRRLLVGEPTAVNAAKEFSSHRERRPLTEDVLLKQASNCTEFRLRGGYRTSPVRPSDVEFPIAFSLLVHWHLEQFEHLLRAIYRPQNLYCIHVDGKTSWTFHAAVLAMARCLDNVYVASRTQHVIYAGYSRLQADIDCMKDHLSKGVQWRYLLNVAGQSYPLRTPEEMVDILRLYNGSNDIEGISGKRRITKRYMKEWRERSDLEKVEETNATNPPPPHDIDIVRGSAYGVFSRAFVEFIINDQRAIDFLDWSRKTFSPDEHYWSTLHHTYTNPHLRTPGGYSGIPDNKPFLAVFVKWYPDHQCAGIWKRGVCVLGVGDLPDLLSQPEFFVNKFAIDFQPLAFECIEAWLEHRVKCNVAFNTTFYQRLPFIYR